MQLKEVMSTRIETASPAESAASAITRMRQSRIRHLVVQDGRKVVGVLSDRDVENLGSMADVETVEDHMSSRVVTASPEMTLRKAANLMRGRSIGCLPVLSDGKLVGIVTTTDLLELIGRGTERPRTNSKRQRLEERHFFRQPRPGPSAPGVGTQTAKQRNRPGRDRSAHKEVGRG
jgi:CBS domain-containing protein